MLYDAGMSTTTHPVESSRLALSAAEVAKLLDISLRHLWKLNSTGRLPKPIHFGRAVRWRTDEIREWLAAGAPSRDRWEAMRPQSAR